MELNTLAANPQPTMPTPAPVGGAAAVVAAAAAAAAAGAGGSSGAGAPTAPSAAAQAAPTAVSKAENGRDGTRLWISSDDFDDGFPTADLKSLLLKNRELLLQLRRAQV